MGYDTTKRTLIRNENYPYLLKNITNELGGLTFLKKVLYICKAKLMIWQPQLKPKSNSTI